ncbi:MAG: hypothetical protein U0271_42150 [Polyangiaceae bacterium]
MRSLRGLLFMAAIASAACGDDGAGGAGGAGAGGSSRGGAGGTGGVANDTPPPALPPFDDGALVLQGWTDLGAGVHGWTHADPDVLWDSTEGLFKMWVSSLRATTCDAGLYDDKVAIYYAESADGLDWTLSNDVAFDVGGDGDWDRDFVETPSVIEVPNAPPERRFALVYAGGRRDEGTLFGQVPIWHLGVAFSPDGRHFTRPADTESPYFGTGLSWNVAGLALRGEDAYPATAAALGVAADPDVVERDGVFHVFFGGAAFSDPNTALTPIGISHATSTDLLSWNPSAGNPILTYVAGTAGQPSVLVEDGVFRMWLSRDTQAELAAVPSALFPTIGFFEATSSDGETFSVSADRVFTWDASRPGEDLGLLAGPAVFRAGDAHVLFYGAFSTAGVPSGSCAIHRTQGFVPGVHRVNVAAIP